MDKKWDKIEWTRNENLLTIYCFFNSYHEPIAEESWEFTSEADLENYICKGGLYMLLKGEIGSETKLKEIITVAS